MLRLAGPLMAQVELTQACNQRCAHCYNFWRYTPKPSKSELRAKDFLRVLDILNAVGACNVTLTGGEPLLKRETAIRMVTHGTQLGMKVTLNTNACRITPAIATRLKTAGLRGALVSVIGTERTHNRLSHGDNYQSALRGIAALIEAKVRVSVNMVVMQGNTTEVLDVARAVVPMGIATFNATPLRICHASHQALALSAEQIKQVLRDLLHVRDEYGIPVDTLEPLTRCIFTEEDEDEFLPFLGRRRCSAAMSSCAISAHGDLRPCATADVTYGNILTEPFADIWERAVDWSCASILPSACASCNANVVCEGGCRMAAKIIHGSYTAPDPYMVGPIMDPERVKKVLPTPIPEIPSDALLQINPECRFRKESFGWSAYNRSAEYITDRAYDIIAPLRDQPCTLNDLSAKYQDGDEALRLLVARLVHAGALMNLQTERKRAS